MGLFPGKTDYYQPIMISGLVKIFGPLRTALLATVLTSIGFSFFSQGQVAYSGWPMVPTLIVPALTPIIFFVLAFDVMMSSILFADSTEAARSRYKTILLTEIVFAIVLLSSWLPYFLSIGS